MIIRKSTAEIETMANAGRVVADTIALVGEHLRPGVTTAELDDLADEYIRSQGGTSSFKGYRGYPASICTSPNDMVVHGIPDGRTMSEGDILSVDVGVELDGFVADSAYTFGVGDISSEAERLLEGCQAALAAGIAQCLAGNRLSTSPMPSRSRPRRPASRSSAASSATGSGVRCTRIPRSPTTALPGAVRSSSRA